MRILIFGAKGQVGRELEELAREKRVATVGFDVDTLDITNSQQVAEIFVKNQDVVAVINTAAYTAVDKAEDEPQKAFAINRNGVANLAIECRKYNLPLIHISTDYVFAGDKIGAYVETDLTGPLNVYGASKLAGEKILQELWEKHLILRTSWVFGKHGQNFVKTILRLAQDREALNVVADQFGCPTAARDLARVILVIVEKIIQDQNCFGIYNYCSFPVTNWYEFARKIVELAYDRFPLKVQEINKTTSEQFLAKAKRPKNSELLVTKITQDYGVVRGPWEEYLQEVITAMAAI